MFSVGTEHIEYDNEFLRLHRNLKQLQLPGKSLDIFFPPKYGLICPVVNTTMYSLNLQLLALEHKNLTKLIVQTSTHHEDILDRILMLNQELEHIEFHKNLAIIGESFIHLSEKIHTFIVENCRLVEPNFLRVVS